MFIVLKPKLFGDKEKVFKKRGLFFLEYDVIDCIASDMHNLHTRPPFMLEVYDAVKSKKDPAKAQELFIDN